MICAFLKSSARRRCAGAQLFLVIANWPVKREMHWVTLLQARAIENQAYVVGVNRCGPTPKFVYSGRSMVVDPHGAILAQIGNEEGIISADVDVKRSNAGAKIPALQDIHWRSLVPARDERSRSGLRRASSISGNSIGARRSDAPYPSRRHRWTKMTIAGGHTPY